MLHDDVTKKQIKKSPSQSDVLLSVSVTAPITLTWHNFRKLIFFCTRETPTSVHRYCLVNLTTLIFHYCIFSDSHFIMQQLEGGSWF